MNVDNQPVRVHFYERQFLRSNDLTDEQAYHLEMRRRHNLALHTWGIAYGLELTGDTSSVRIGRGIAIDGYGRELVLPQEVSVPGLNSKQDPGPFDIWLEFSLIDIDDGTVQATVCTNCNGQAPKTRLRENPTVTKTPTAARQDPSPTAPNPVPPGDLDFSPERVPPDDPLQRWPVFLGKIEYRLDPAQPTEPSRWQVDSTERRYAGLVAENIASPASRAAADSGQASPSKSSQLLDSPPAPGSEELQQTMIQNGSEPGRAPYLFGVYVWGDGPLPDETLPALAVDNKGSVSFNTMQLSVDGDLSLMGGSAMEFVANPFSRNEDEEEAQGKVLLPWRIYHYRHAAPSPNQTKAGTGGAASNGPPPVSPTDDGYRDELRITMAGDPPGTNQVVIGYWTDKGKFAPVLTVQDNGNVIVDGNLVVKGGIDPGTSQVTAPAGTSIASGPGAGGSLTDDQLFFAQLETRFGNSDSARADILNILNRVKGDYIAQNIPQILTRDNLTKLCTTVWSDTIPTGREVLGHTAPIDEAPFKQFLTGIDLNNRSKQTANFLSWIFDSTAPERLRDLSTWIFDTTAPERLRDLSAWIFDGTNPGRATTLAQNFPATSAAVANFVGGLPDAQRKALVDALTSQSMSVVVDSQLSANLPAFVQQLMNRVFLGATPPAREAFINTLLPLLPADPQALSAALQPYFNAAMGPTGARGKPTASTAIDSTQTVGGTSTPVGFIATSLSLGDGLDTLSVADPANPTIPDARFIRLLKHIKQQTAAMGVPNEYLRLRFLFEHFGVIWPKL